jgi:hypothetical protein
MFGKYSARYCPLGQVLPAGTGVADGTAVTVAVAALVAVLLGSGVAVAVAALVAVLLGSGVAVAVAVPGGSGVADAAPPMVKALLVARRGE